ncbi:hypothetical protein KR067_013520, partial [Drosophila pandora]
VAAAFLVAQSWSECNVCQNNQVACINSSSFYLCFGDGTPHTDQLYHCLDGFDCTNLSAICVQKSSQRPPSCGDTSKCGQCSASVNYLFACQSRGIFQMCYGATRPMGKFGYCPTGTVCDATSNAICVPEVANQNVTCDLNDDLVDTTTSAPTTSEPTTNSTGTESTTEPSTTEPSTTEPSTTEPSTTEQSTTEIPLTPSQICALYNATGLFPIIPSDPYCQRYVSCYLKNNVVIRAAEYNCATDSYFVSLTQSCVYIKPGYCL